LAQRSATFAGAVRGELAALLLAGWIGLTVAGALLHLLATLARVRDFRRRMPAPAPARDAALVGAAGIGVLALATSHLPGLGALLIPASGVLLGIAGLLRRADPDSREVGGSGPRRTGDMKRHPALEPLSRDHHHALAVALRLCRATPEDAWQASAGFLALWEIETRIHFRFEEEILLPAYAAHGDPGDPVVIQTLIDHMSIRRDAALIASGAPLATLQAPGERLASQVRLEERELFPLIEATLDEGELEAVGARLRSLTE
jgi:hypothetical protein